MKNSKIVMTFYNEEGEVVRQLCKDPADMNEIAASLMFLDEGCEIRLARVACDENGNKI